MTYKVIQWATGGLGKAAIEHIVRHPDLELVGCWVHSDDKNGRDVGDIVGMGPIGVTATSDQDEVLALEADCVLYSQLFPDPAEVDRILRSGKNVVTPLGWFWPSDEERASIEPAALAGGVTLFGTGIDPGGITEQYPLLFSAMSSAVTYVRGEEFSDIRTYNAPEVVTEIMGFAKTPEQALNSPMLGLLTGGFVQSVKMCLDTLGFADAEIRPTHEMAVATKRIDFEGGTIEPGHVAAQRFAWEAFVGDQAVVRVAVNWLMGDEHLDPPWTFGEQGQRFEMEIKGDPDCHVVVHGWHPDTIEEGLLRNRGIVATAAHCVNAIPYVCAAPPGVATFVDLPMVAGRAHPDLARSGG